MESAVELDSHTDSPDVGKVARIIRRTGKHVSMSGFTDKIGKPIRVPVVGASVLFKCDRMGLRYLMVI